MTFKFAAKKKTATVGLLTVVVFVFVIIVIAVGCIYFATENNESGTPVVDKGMRFDNMDVRIEWNDDRSCRIAQTIDVRFFESSHGIYVDIPVNSGEKVRDLDVKSVPSRPFTVEHVGKNKLVRIKVGDPYLEFVPNSTMKCTVEYEYITPKHPRNADVLAFNAIGGGWTCYTKHASVKMTYPAAPLDAGDDYGIWTGGDKVNENSDGITVEWSNDGKTVEIDISGRHKYYTYGDEEYCALKPFENVELAYLMPKGVLKTRFDTEFVIALCVGFVLLAAVVSLKVFLAKNKTVTPVVSFYPPRIDGVKGDKRQMLPVQMGKLIDGTCSTEDVTSLVFYWANKGYLFIEEREDDTYFVKQCDINEVTTYERKMFNKLFSYGSEGDGGKVEVALGDLRGKFGNTVTATAAAVNSEYKGRLYKGRFNAITAAAFVLTAVYGAAFTLLTGLRVGFEFNVFGCFTAVAGVFVAAGIGILHMNYSYKLSAAKNNMIYAVRAVVCLLFALFAAFSVPKDVMGMVEKAVFAICLGACALIAPSLRVRTDFYTEQLEYILGFRNFLRDAEKDRLETLLEDDPQYYYGILPYANVLGVTDIWSDKFKDIAVEPPTYYSSYNGIGVFDVMVMHRLTNNVRSGLTYVPPSSSSGSFSSIGGGSSGGGFSGGSFGGGGGGRW